MFSYRHAFHAGNHADVLKHTVLIAALRYMTQKDAALNVFDTHAGAGLYRLDGDYAQTSAEAAQGFLRLVSEKRAEPFAPALQDYIDFVGPANVIELKVQWDAGRIEQLMANLLENSLRYTHAPGQILVRLEFDEHLIRLVVEDSAPGVSDSHLPQLFEPLYRVDTARSNESGGSGLGLAICQVIAYAHEGHLTAAASGLGGLSLRLELPRMSGVIQTELTGATP